LSTFGWIVLSEQCWRRGRGLERPFSQHAQVKARGSSRRVQRALTDFGADEAFAPAAAKFKEHYGVEVGASRVRETTLHHARRLAANQPAPVRTLPAQGPAVIIAEADGTMVPIVDTTSAPAGADRRKYRQLRWQEARLVAAQADGSATTHYGATLHGVEATGDLWENVVRAAGRGMQTAVHGVGDGAAWIAEQCLRRFDPFVRYTLDLYHVCDYLAAATPPSGPGVTAQRELLRANRSVEVLAQLRPRLEPAEQPDELAPVRCAVRYLENRPDQLDYAGALARGLPVGSGLIESGHRHVLQKRIKLAGAWWTPDNLHALAQLRTCRANARFDAYWASN
jgi:hypothetical protein